MVFGTEPHLESARAHLESGEAGRLRYACLELRLALERIAYQKLQLRLDKITFEEIGAWQPRRAMDRVMELVDEHLASDSVVQIAPQNADGGTIESEFVTLGATKGVNPREIGRHWQKLGSFLHVEVPRKKGDRPREPDKQALREYLGEVIGYVEDLTSTKFDSHFAKTVTFTCDKCGQSVVRNANLLKDGAIVQCQNPNCTASYIAREADGQRIFELYQLPFECLTCKERNTVPANELLKLDRHQSLTLTCVACGAGHTAWWAIQLKPAPQEIENLPV